MFFRRVVAPSTFLIALLAAMGFGSPLALAETHPFTNISFGRSATETFSNPNGIAVEESTGDVYVADIGTDTVSKFDANGTPVAFECTTCGAYITGNQLTGTPSGPFGFSTEPFAKDSGNPAALAVDNSCAQQTPVLTGAACTKFDPSAGDLYVLDAGHEVIDKFNAKGEALTPITGPFTYPPLGIGIDPSGNVRVDVRGPSAVELAVEVFDDSAVNDFLALVGVDLAANSTSPSGGTQVYGFATAGQSGGDYPLLSPESSGGCGCVARLGPNGTHYGRVDGGSAGVAAAVDPATGHVYVDDQSALAHSVSEWDTGEMNGVPELSISETEQDIKATGTEVSSFGSLELTGSSEHEQGGIAVNGATGDVYVSNPADGKVYVFGSAGPVTVVAAPSGVTQTSATLQGSVDPRGVAVTECRFEYDTDPSNDLRLPIALLEHSVPCVTAHGEPIGAGNGPVAVHADVGLPPEAALQPGSLYHYRLVVSNANGESHSGGLFPTASAGFGFKQFEVSFLNRDSTPDVQAGSHPYKMVTNIVFNTQVVREGTLESNSSLLYVPLPAGNVKDLIFHFPPGFYGDPNATAKKCTLAQLAPGSLHDTCPPESELGTLESEFNGAGSHAVQLEGKKLVNVVPPPGVALQMAAKILLPDAFIDAGVPAGGDSGGTAVSEGIPATVPLFRNTVTIFGVPPLGSTKPLLTLPTACNGPLTSTVSGDSYQDAGHFATASSVAPGMSDCAPLVFPPTIETKPDVPDASSSSGLVAGVHISQKAALNPTGLAESGLRDLTVALPPGVAINPADADGLEACSGDPSTLAPGALGSPGDQFGYLGFKEFNILEPGDKTATFSQYLPESVDALAAGYEEASEPGRNFCPNGSKIGTVKGRTPLLPNPLEGTVYLAAQEANPFGGLLALYLVAEDPVSGTLVKLTGKVSLCENAGEVLDGVSCEAPGQIVTTFKNIPNDPIEEAEFHFFGGERAPLRTPSRCGTYTTKASFTPWDGNGPVHTISSFQIEHGPYGTPCPGASLPFNTSANAGSTNIQAGAFTSFTLSAIRHDGEQNVQSLQGTLPPGLSGRISNIAVCPEPQANEGLCPQSSEIGETTVTVGVGSHPFTVTGGKLYLTGPYNGTGGCAMSTPGCAPFGLTFEVPAKAGPFDLEKTAKHHPACDCLVVRGKAEINPITSALTITTNPPGTEHSIPTMLEGIPLEVQQVNGTTTRPNFQFNPTNCAKMQLTGHLFSTEDAQDTIELPYQVTNCAALKFEPKLTVSTSGKTSKADGASLTTKLTYPNVPQGTDADIAKVKVELPKQLPSRLTTLQKACTAKQFEANPAGCPPESKIGYAVVHTPVLPVPLEGPAIFVSHGGEAFPSVEIVLQGDNVTIDIVGTTFISKAGITSTDFKTVPDQPFSTFELTLQEGKFSALTANLPQKDHYSFCGQKLTMPTEFVAQNGAEVHKSTPITVEGCSTSLSFTHSIKKKTLTLSVYAPAAGKITASGMGLTSKTKTAKGQEDVTFTLKEKKAGKLKTTVRVAFTPSTGKDRKKQSKSAKLTFKEEG